MNSISINCVLVGGQTLLIQCAETLLARQHVISGIVSSDPQVARWAADHDLVVWPEDEKLASRLAALEFDYLFSIVNLKITPDYMIKAPRQAAINFHDGLLPDYAGLNVTSWALLNAESEHGVTWHEMLTEVDEGQVFVERRLAIVPGETALTLNAKCLEAGLETFTELVSGIESQSLRRSPQAQREGRFFKGNDKPDDLGVLNFQGGARVVERQVNALDFGHYRNPISGAKAVTDAGHVYLATGARVNATSSQSLPGTILDIDAESGAVTVATADQDISLLKVVGLGGSNSLTPGDVLASPEDLGSDLLVDLSGTARRSENFWIRQLRTAVDLNISFSAAHWKPRTIEQFSCAKFDSDSMSGQRALAAICAYLQRLSGGEQVSVPLVAATADSSRGLFAAAVPLKQKLTNADSFDQFADRFDVALQNALSHQSFCVDVFKRHLGLESASRRWSDGRHPIAIAVLTPEQTLPKIPPAPLVVVLDSKSGNISWWHDANHLSQGEVQALYNRVERFSAKLLNGESPATAGLLSDQDEAHFQAWNATDTALVDATVHGQFEAAAAKTPEATAVSFRDRQYSFGELEQRANQWANFLVSRNVQPGDRVGVALERSEHLMAAMLGIMKAGAAYVPLDPDYPEARVAFMATDAGVVLVLASGSQVSLPEKVPCLGLGDILDEVDAQPGTRPDRTVDAQQLAYMIYTSGSTGTPKGVMVSHRNVINFFAGMDQRIDAEPVGVWMAVTSISFDISVLEVFWTLCRGFKVVIAPRAVKAGADDAVVSQHPDKKMAFSLFFWNFVNEADRDDPQKYRLLMDAAAYADANGFEAIWTPERHFGAFGGFYPNPSVISAALAVHTRHLKIRAGSVVMPLHSPIRVAEDWSVVDNLSGGRVGISFAAGWQPNDFVIKPEGFENAKQVMLDGIDTVQRLWRGEGVEFEGPKGTVTVKTLPRPIQDELPVWITTAGNPESFRAAGERGANLLTHLLGQTVEQVGENIKLYREAWRAAGHAGTGHITLMLHTLVGDDEDTVREKAREPMKNYLKSAMFLVKDAAWEFPTFKKMSEETGRDLDEFFANISDDDMDALLEFAFQRYYGSSGLFGTPQRCMQRIDSLKEIGVDEIGCLVDYGLQTDEVMEHLPAVGALLKQANPEPEAVADDPYQCVHGQMVRHGATHFQCTPSQLQMLVADPDAHEAIAKLSHLMVGGEPLSLDLVRQVRQFYKGRLTNMYGPTETTIWSTTWDVPMAPERIAIGSPIANTQIHIVDKGLAMLPPGAVGEIVIGGQGVVPGYHERPELNEERFVPLPGSTTQQGRIYRTGDLGRFDADGVLECLGRSDTQVKIRGYRVELGEIEAAIADQESTEKVAVLMREDNPGDQRLVAYLETRRGYAVADAAQWRKTLALRLPEFMIPAHYVELTDWPLTPNGKLDRKALPAPQQAGSESSVMAPLEGLESTIAAIWCELLNRDQVGVNLNFFDIGGHSLLAVQVLNKVRGVVASPVQMTDLFRFPTIRTLARYLEQDGDGSDPGALESSDARAAARRQSIARRRQPRKRQSR